MHEIDIEQIQVYSYCPMLYKYIYVDDNYKHNLSLKKEYNSAVKKALFGFLASSEDTNPGFNNIKCSWGRLWIKEKRTIEYVYSKPKSWRDSHNELRKAGIFALKTFYDYYCSKELYPIMYNKKFSIMINNIKLNGRFDFVVEENKKIKLIIFKPNERKFNMVYINKDVEITATSYAFNKLFDLKEDNIILYNSIKGKFIKTSRNEKDFKDLEETVTNVYKCINNDIFYISPSEKCSICPCKELCSK